MVRYDQCEISSTQQLQNAINFGIDIINRMSQLSFLIENNQVINVYNYYETQTTSTNPQQLPRIEPTKAVPNRNAFVKRVSPGREMRYAKQPNFNKQHENYNRHANLKPISKNRLPSPSRARQVNLEILKLEIQGLEANQMKLNLNCCERINQMNQEIARKNLEYEIKEQEIHIFKTELNNTKKDIAALIKVINDQQIVKESKKEPVRQKLRHTISAGTYSPYVHMVTTNAK